MHEKLNQILLTHDQGHDQLAPVHHFHQRAAHEIMKLQNQHRRV